MKQRLSTTVFCPHKNVLLPNLSAKVTLFSVLMVNFAAFLQKMNKTSTDI